MSEEILKEKLNSEDVLLSLEDLMAFKIAPGSVYWVKRDQVKVPIRKAGDPIDKAYFKKFEKGSYNFVVSSYTRLQFINDASSILRMLEEASFESEKWELRIQFVNWFQRNYLDEDSQASLLEFLLVGTKSFFRLNEQIEIMLIEHSIEKYRRSALAGMFAVSFAICLGYLDYKTLQDIYHLFYLQDMSFILTGANYVFNEALEKERQKSGEGLAWMKEIDWENQHDKLKSHPLESHKALANSFSSLLNEKQWSEIILHHHEKLDGSGLCTHVNADELSDLEQIYILINYLIPYKEMTYGKSDGAAFVANLLNTTGKDNHEIRLLNNILHAFKEVEELEVKSAS